MRLREHVRAVFEARGRQHTIAAIADSTGLPYDWLSNYSRKRLVSIDVDKLQTLFEHLTGDTSRLTF